MTPGRGLAARCGRSWVGYRGGVDGAQGPFDAGEGLVGRYEGVLARPPPGVGAQMGALFARWCAFLLAGARLC